MSAIAAGFTAVGVGVLVITTFTRLLCGTTAVEVRHAYIDYCMCGCPFCYFVVLVSYWWS